METIEHLFIGLEQCTLAPSLNNTKAVTAAEWPQVSDRINRESFHRGLFPATMTFAEYQDVARCDDSQLPAVVSEPSRGSAALPRDGDIVWRAQRASGVRYRWWYMTPDWPPEDFDYDGALRKLKLRRVEVDEWENAEDCEEGYTKVYEIKHYTGCFRDPSGRFIDVRPREGRPCYSDMIKKSERELAEMLVEAIQKQQRELEASSDDASGTKEALEEELTAAQRMLDSAT